MKKHSLVLLSLLLSVSAYSKERAEESFNIDPWLSEMKCSAKGMDFSEMTLNSASRANSVFGLGVKSVKASWKGVQGTGEFSLIYKSPAQKLAFKSSGEVPQNFPAHPSGFVEGMQNPNPGTFAMNLPWLSYNLQSIQKNDRAIFSMLGFTDPSWKMLSASGETSGDDEKYRIVVRAAGENLKTGRQFSIECGGVLTLPPRDINPIDPDMEMTEFSIYAPLPEGGRRLGKIRGSKRLSEWEEENR